MNEGFVVLLGSYQEFLHQLVWGLHLKQQFTVNSCPTVIIKCLQHFITKVHPSQTIS